MYTLYTGSDTSNVLVYQWHGTASCACTLTQGTQYGNFSTGYPATMFVSGVVFDPSTTHTLIAKATWAVTSANVYVNPLMRSLIATRYLCEEWINGEDLHKRPR